MPPPQPDRSPFPATDLAADRHDVQNDDAWMEHVNFVLCLVMVGVLFCHRVYTFHLTKPAPMFASPPTPPDAPTKSPPSNVMHQFHEWFFATSAADSTKECTVLDQVIDTLLLTPNEPHHDDAPSLSESTLGPKLCEVALMLLVFALQVTSLQHRDTSSYRSYFFKH